MKKGLLIGVVVLVVGFVLWVLMADQKELPKLEGEVAQTEDEVEVIDTEDSGDTNVGKIVKKEAKKVAAKQPKDKDYAQKLDDLIETNRKEIEECEIGLDKILGNAVEDENDPLYREDNILETLEEFDRATLTPPSSGKLLELMAQDKLGSFTPEELGSKIRDLRPCRPYKKMTFIHNLMSQAKKKQWSSETKTKICKSVTNYFNKELGQNTTISNLNMQAALLENMVSEGFYNNKYQEKIEEFKEELEDSYDELLDEADEVREKQESSGGTTAIPLEIIRAEFEIAKKFREGFKNLVNTVKCKAD